MTGARSRTGAQGYVRKVASTLIDYSPLFAILVLWQLAGSVGLLPAYIAPVNEVFATLVTLLRDGSLWHNAKASLSIIYVGFIGGATAGIILGAISGRSRLISQLFDPLVSITYPVPKIAFFPLFLVWLGLGFKSKTAILFLAVFYPVYINTYDGARGVKQNYIRSAQNFNASQFTIFSEVVIPAILPHIFSGLRVGVALAFIVVFSAELISSKAGLGHLVELAQSGQNFPLMYAAIFTIAILGFVHERAIRYLGDYLIYWDTSEGI